MGRQLARLDISLKCRINPKIRDKIKKTTKKIQLTSKMERVKKDYQMTAKTQPAFTCPKLTIETLEQGVKYVQS